MNIEIIKAVNNERYVSRKEEDYYWLAWDTKRIWLKEELKNKPDLSVIYEMQFANGLLVEGQIISKGTDENGSYIVFHMGSYDLDNDRIKLKGFRIPKGEATLVAVFNPHEDPVFGQLLYENQPYQYGFNESFMNFSRTSFDLDLNFVEGSLGDTGINLKLGEIIREDYNCEEESTLESFRDGKINKLYFRKNSHGQYVIKIDNSYQDFIYPPGRSYLSEPVEPKIINHDNRAIITCQSLSIQKYNRFIAELKEHGIRCIELKKFDASKPEKLRQKWVEIFLNGVDTKNIYIEQFLWHAFSYNRMKGLEKGAAQQALANEKKEVLYLFFNDEGDTRGYRLENSGAFTHEMLRYYQDIYVVDEDFTWTYIFTHEEHCGPYFYAPTEC